MRRARGIVRLLNTADGRALCLAGEVDADAVDSFVRRYGAEPVRVDRIDAASVTSLSDAAVHLVQGHLDAAERAGRPVAVCGPPGPRRWFAGGATPADPPRRGGAAPPWT